MAEPTTTVGSLTAAISVVTLAALGVDYYSLLYGLVGALFGLSQVAAVARAASAAARAAAAVSHIAFSTILGASFGNAALAAFGTSNRALLIFGCLVGGYGAQLIVAAAVKATINRIALLGGGAGLDGQLPNDRPDEEVVEVEIRNER